MFAGLWHLAHVYAVSDEGWHVQQIPFAPPWRIGNVCDPL